MVLEECGIFGIYMKNHKGIDKTIVPKSIYLGLNALQHRGQLSAGVVSWDFNPGVFRKTLNVLKGGGEVDEVFQVRDEFKSKSIISNLRGYAGIGHVRYSTRGATKNYQSIINGTQPFQRRHGRLWKRFALAFNGNLSNYKTLKQKLKNDEYYLDTDTDTEVIMHLISKNLNEFSVNKKKPDLFEVNKLLMNQLEGAYSLVELFADGDLVAVRDPKGFKPYVWGENRDFFALASESTALKKMGIEKFYDVNAGSMVLFNRKGVREKQLVKERKSHCHFEWVYFSRATSVIEGKAVNQVRKNLGRNLAENEILDLNKDYIVIPVPNTPIPVAKEYAKCKGLECNLSIVKLSDKRGFINKKSSRKRIINSAYEIMEDEVCGKKLIVIDDSIVRGETSLEVVKKLKRAGAKEIHLRSSEPIIKYPCFYGIDFPNPDELAANKYQDIERELKDYLGIESVRFQSLEGLVDAIGLEKEDLCLACLNGEYPNKSGKELWNKIQNGRFRKKN